jgi:hypothetical protein
VCVRVSWRVRLLGRGLPPPFIGSRRGGLHARVIFDVAISPRIGGEQLIAPVAEHCEAWRQAWSSSFEALDHARDVSLPCGASGRRGDSCRARRPLRLTGRSTEGVC